MANQSNLERLVSAFIGILQELCKSFHPPSITADNSARFLEELRLLRTDNATFQQQVVHELGELRRTIGSGLKAFESRDAPMNARDIASYASLEYHHYSVLNNGAESTTPKRASTMARIITTAGRCGPW